MSTWIVEIFYKGELHQSYKFKTMYAAHDFYTAKKASPKFDPVLGNWSVFKPRQEEV